MSDNWGINPWKWKPILNTKLALGYKVSVDMLVEFQGKVELTLCLKKEKWFKHYQNCLKLSYNSCDVIK